MERVFAVLMVLWFVVFMFVVLVFMSEYLIDFFKNKDK